jgi:DNA oxidative demethylase
LSEKLQNTLFDLSPGRLPEGLVYRPEFVSPADADILLSNIRELDFSDVRMRGVTARRRVAQFGWTYRFEPRMLEMGRPIPEFLLPLRDRVAGLCHVESAEFGEALITEYPRGATIGWHRDAPVFGIVAGVSLGSSCRFRMRRGEGRKAEQVSLELRPRSVYVLDGAARTEWQHSIPATDGLRYSVTFRTLRRTSPDVPTQGA